MPGSEEDGEGEVETTEYVFVVENDTDRTGHPNGDDDEPGDDNLLWLVGWWTCVGKFHLDSFPMGKIHRHI